LWWGQELRRVGGSKSSGRLGRGQGRMGEECSPMVGDTGVLGNRLSYDTLLYEDGIQLEVGILVVDGIQVVDDILVEVHILVEDDIQIGKSIQVEECNQAQDGIPVPQSVH